MAVYIVLKKQEETAKVVVFSNINKRRILENLQLTFMFFASKKIFQSKVLT